MASTSQVLDTIKRLPEVITEHIPHSYIEDIDGDTVLLIDLADGSTRAYAIHTVGMSHGILTIDAPSTEAISSKLGGRPVGILHVHPIDGPGHTLKVTLTGPTRPMRISGLHGLREALSSPGGDVIDTFTTRRVDSLCDLPQAAAS